VEDKSAEPRLSHTGADGQAHMVDVADKPVTTRLAEAEGRVSMLPTTLALVKENAAAKGDVLSVARIAGIMAAKQTSALIPLCHGLPLDQVEVDFALDEADTGVVIQARARTQARTGVEMEALTAVAVAGLTIYDMLKGVDRAMVIGGIRVTLKSGGRSGLYRADMATTPVRTP
jgi:cyclic pyranopterin monophosphate synthase